MEFLLQLFAELMINKEDELVKTNEPELEITESIEGQKADDFFGMMHFH